MDLDYDQMRQTLEGGAKKPNVQTTRSANIVHQAGRVAKAGLMNVPYIQNALEVLDQVADIGQGMPFVQPAFVLLKFIIEVEKKAQEADAKCKDIIERITFMLSHLPVLKKIKVIEPTRLVIERMNGALKDAAALIAAYRKQGAVARRLHVHNKDKFAHCAGVINGCSKDLMMSLQIHQTARLDILTRAVPVDPEDEAAQAFVASHGSLDAVKQNPELVNQFAKEQHLKMDDEVMVQLNMNITDTMEETMGRLEDMIQGNVSEAIINGLKGLAAEMNAKEAEQRFKCVQCDKEFIASTNGPKSCSFHKAAYESWNKDYPCCSMSNPCQFQSHRAAHHCDYPYGSFFAYASGILNYTSTVEKWASVLDTNLEDGTVQKASVGRLLLRASRGAVPEAPTILITVGTVWHDKPYFFDTFTARDLESVAESIRVTGKTVIYRTSSSASEFAMAEWVVSSDGKVCAVRLTAKAATSDSPFIRVCPIDADTCTKSGDVLTLSEGGIHSYKPATPYVIPETVRVGPGLNDVPLRRARTDFKTRTSPALRVVLKTMSDPPLTADQKFPSYEVDHLQGEVSVFNSHAAGSSNPVTIASASAVFRLVGDEDYVPVRDFEILGGFQLPMTVDPRQSWRFKFQVAVPRTKEDAQIQINWWNRAFVARHRPLRIKLVLEDIEGEECSIVLEYVFNPHRLKKQEDGDLAFFYFDDPVRIERHAIHVKENTNGRGLLDIEGVEIEAERLDKAVYQALKSGETEIALQLGTDEWHERDGIWEIRVWALVDISCRRVYAFKIVLKEGRLVSTKRFACLGYVPCPDYGEGTNGSRPICYATEKVKLLDLVPYDIPEYTTDDELDDFVPAPPQATAEPAASSASFVTSGPSMQMVIPKLEELSLRLASIDSTLARIATSMERSASGRAVRR